MNSKPPTIPFGIVACTFSDNLSRNSCIRLCISGIEARSLAFYFPPRSYFLLTLARSWLKIDRTDQFYAWCLRRYLHGPQSCFPSSEKRCTLILKSSGPLQNLLLQQNGEIKMLLLGLCVYNYNQICEEL